jgi:hypothetical protein
VTTRWEKTKLQLNSDVERIPVPIVSDAAMSSIGVADGRLLPLVIIDTSNRPDIEDAIKVHKHLGPGDAESVWLKPSSRDDTRIGLFLSLTKPSRCIVLLEFDIASMGSLVDLIVHGRGLYLQSGRTGDRLKTTMDKERILVEVPSKGFQEEWNKIYHRTIEKVFRRRGVNKQEAKRMAEELITSLRKVGSFRLKDGQ